MKLKTLVLLAMALGCGLIAMVGVQQVLAERQGNEAATVEVLVARSEIDPGAEITETNTIFEVRPQASVPDGAVVNKEQYMKRATTIRLFPGEIVIQKKLGEPGVIGIAAQIPQGMRVVAVPVNLTTSLSGMISAGNKVDIVVTYSLQKNGMQYKKTKQVLSNIEVFAVDRVRHAESGDASKASSKPENVSFLVTPQQAQTLSYAGQKGTLQLVLRGASDIVDVEMAHIDDESFEGLESEKGTEQAAEEPAKPAPAPEVTAPEPQKDLQAFLNAPPPPPAPAPAPLPEPEVVVAPREIWSIEIYDGETKRVETMELIPEPTKVDEATANGGSWWKRLITDVNTPTKPEAKHKDAKADTRKRPQTTPPTAPAVLPPTTPSPETQPKSDQPVADGPSLTPDELPAVPAEVDPSANNQPVDAAR
jgi:pilus assembly protein CpaB